VIADVGFAVLAALVVLTSGMVTIARNLVHAVFWLAATLIVSAGIMVWLGAPFVAGIQIVLYTGGVITLMIFAVMLTTREATVVVPNPVHRPAAAGFASMTLLAVLLAAIWTTPELEPQVVAERSEAATRTFDAHFMVERTFEVPEVQTLSDEPGAETTADGYSEPTRAELRARELTILEAQLDDALSAGQAEIVSTSAVDRPDDPVVRVWLKLSDPSEAGRVAMWRQLAGVEGRAVELDVTAQVGRSLLTDHLLAFEALSVLLLAAMIGAIVLSRRKDP